jgi:hypothetical protein
MFFIPSPFCDIQLRRHSAPKKSPAQERLISIDFLQQLFGEIE